MKINPARATRPLFVASMVLFIVSLVFTVTNVATVLSAPLRALSAPATFGYEGYLADAYGNPVADGAYALLFSVYSVASGGTPIAQQTITTTVTNGYYSVVIGPLSPNPFAEPYANGNAQWIGVKVNGGTEILPRTQIASVPYALVARAVDWDGIVNKPTGVGSGNVVGTGTAGQAAVWTGSNTIAGTNALTLTGGLNVGSATGAGTGELRASGDVRAQAGLYVGANADPPDNDIIADGGISLGTNSDPGNGNVLATGYVQQAEISAPSSPSSGALRWYADSTQSWGYFKNDAGRQVPAGISKLYLDPADGLDSGTSIVSLASHFLAVQFPGNGGDSFRFFNRYLPPGWAGRTLTIRWLWSPTNTSTGNARWQVIVKRIANGVTIDSSTPLIADVLSAGSGVVDRPVQASQSFSLSSFNEGDAFQIRIGRLDSQGNDTFTGAANLLAIELSVVN